jgi:hypothetical protein
VILFQAGVNEAWRCTAREELWGERAFDVQENQGYVGDLTIYDRYRIALAKIKGPPGWIPTQTKQLMSSAMCGTKAPDPLWAVWGCAIKVVGLLRHLSRHSCAVPERILIRIQLPVHPPKACFSCATARHSPSIGTPRHSLHRERCFHARLYIALCDVSVRLTHGHCELTNAMDQLPTDFSELLVGGMQSATAGRSG